MSLEQLSLFPPDQPPARPPAGPPPALSVAVTTYLVHLARLGKARHTLDATRRDLDQLTAAVGDRPVDEVSRDDLDRFIGGLRRDRANGTASLRRKVATLKSFFRFARREGQRRDDPSATLPYPAPEEHEVEPLSDEQVERLLAEAPGVAHRALFLLMLEAGLKREEVLALQVQDIGLEQGGAVQVSRALAAKRARARAVPLGGRLRAALEEHLRELGPADPLFPLSTRGVDFVVREAGKRAGVPPVGSLTPQRLRDTFAVRWLAERRRRERREPGPDARRRLEAGHDRELLELLGLSPATLAAGRYRRAAGRLEYDRAEGPLLPRDDLGAAHQLEDRQEGRDQLVEGPAGDLGPG